MLFVFVFLSLAYLLLLYALCFILERETKGGVEYRVVNNCIVLSKGGVEYRIRVHKRYGWISVNSIRCYRPLTYDVLSRFAKGNKIWDSLIDGYYRECKTILFLYA